MSARTFAKSSHAIVALAAMLMASQVSGAASVVVTNYGTDSGNCGSAANPCRSISQAIENAASGDTIWVGAGHYGDLSGDGLFDAPGSEHAQVFTAGFDYDACAICIFKSVQIYSYSGADVTTIQVGPNSITPTTVLLATNRATFGAQGHGFTITGGNTNGVVIDFERLPDTFDVTVSGNTDLKDGTGFVFDGPQFNPDLPNSCPPPSLGPCPLPKGTLTVSWNTAIGSGTGFHVEPKLAFQLLTYLLDNVATGTGIGFVVDPGGVECDDCFDSGRAPGVTTTNNVASDGGQGFNMLSTGPIVGNVAINNSVFGFQIVDVPSFQQNTAIGNAGPGVIVGFYVQGQGSSVPLSYTGIDENNFYGNDRNRPSISLGFLFGASNGVGPSAHCGLLNVGAVGWNNVVGGPATTTPPPEIGQAKDNYWGSPSGPAPTGGGDMAGGACDEFGGITNAKPFLTTAHARSGLP
jgi:hypothetical protein